MMNLILLQATEGAAQQGSQWSFWVMLTIICVIFYFVMIRPKSSKKEKDKAQQKSIQKGDKVVTDGGLYGYVVDVREDMLVILITDGVKIEAKMDTVKLVEKAKQQPVQEMVCPICGKSYDESYEFCPHCGGKKVKECPNCHKRGLPPSATFCPECGTKI